MFLGLRDYFGLRNKIAGKPQTSKETGKSRKVEKQVNRSPKYMEKTEMVSNFKWLCWFAMVFAKVSGQGESRVLIRGVVLSPGMTANPYH